MLVKTKGIVLNTFRYGDDRLMVEMLTRESGRLTFSQRLLASGRGRTQRQCLQPLTILDLEFDHRERLAVQRLSSMTIFHPYSSIPFEERKILMVMFLSEFLTNATRGERDCQMLFDFIEQSLLWLDAAEKDYVNFHLVFMMRLTLFFGFSPNLDNFTEDSYFSLQDASFVPLPPPHPFFVRPEQASHIPAFLRMDYGSMGRILVSRQVRNWIADNIILFYKLHLPDFRQLKSLDVLREMAE